MKTRVMNSLLLIVALLQIVTISLMSLVEINFENKAIQVEEMVLNMVDKSQDVPLQTMQHANYQEKKSPFKEGLSEAPCQWAYNNESRDPNHLQNKSTINEQIELIFCKGKIVTANELEALKRVSSSINPEIVFFEGNLNLHSQFPLASRKKVYARHMGTMFSSPAEATRLPRAIYL
jgi:pyridoxal biosynthesis lyase PdxS